MRAGATHVGGTGLAESAMEDSGASGRVLLGRRHRRFTGGTEGEYMHVVTGHEDPAPATEGVQQCSTARFSEM